MGDDHPDTLETMLILAPVLHDESRLPEAKAVLDDAIDHLMTLTARAALADLEVTQGILEEVPAVVRIDRYLAELRARRSGGHEARP